MANKKYFDHFTPIFYNDYKCINLTQRASFLESVYSNPFVYYPYELNSGDRADTIAGDYYTDPYMSWLVYYANKVIDPYYDWYLDDDELNTLIVQKYGTVANAQSRTIFYRVDWADDDQNITTSYFDNTLHDSLKKYWQAEYAPNGTTISYKRAQQDFTMNTNMLLKLNVTMNGNTTFQAADVLKFRTGSANVGTMEVLTANTTVVTGQHVNIEVDSFPLDNDEWEVITPNATFFAVSSSGANANITSYAIMQRNIPITETTYWSPVSYYDYEVEQNEGKKMIYLLDSRYSGKAKEELRIAMKE
jgi:hypothetical protein